MAPVLARPRVISPAISLRSVPQAQPGLSDSDTGGPVCPVRALEIGAERRGNTNPIGSAAAAALVPRLILVLSSGTGDDALLVLEVALAS
jgi:hypothetical protein